MQRMADLYYSLELHGPFETHDLGDFDLDEGGKIRGLKLAYTAFGTLSPNKDNAILFPTWYSTECDAKDGLLQQRRNPRIDELAIHQSA
jgi:homoserine acetyltransferase